MAAESSIELASANLVSARLNARASRADVDKAQAQMSEAVRKTSRYRELYEHQVISQDRLDEVATASDAAAAEYEAAASRSQATAAQETAAAAQLAVAQKQRELAVADLAQARAGLAYSQAKLADTVISSPLSGTVVFKALEVGETVSPGVTILTIDDLGHLYARVDVDETWIDAIALGGDATVTTQGGHMATGKISRIGHYAEFATETDVTGGRQDIKTFKVRIALDDPEGFLKPGMTVEVEIAKRSGR
jgi:HlyD family secretion protein